MHRSALFWRITACLFASILFIEGMLLVYSWFSERNRVTSRLEDSAHVLVSTLDLADPAPQLYRLIENPIKNSELRVLAFLHKGSDGSVSSRGDLPESIVDTLNANQNYFDSQTNTIITRYDRTLENGKSDVLILCIDAGWIADYMEQYVWRILFMITIISLFLTMACLFFLKPLLIDPLRRLEQLLTFNKSSGINYSKVDKKDSERRDELGAVFRSFTELREKISKAETKLEHQANHDALTGLANRRKMTNFLDSCIDNYATEGTQCSLLILDLDYFKEVNDTAGHSAGDCLLTTIACLLRDNTSSESLVVRQGGDEFAVILPGVNLEGAITVAETIRESLDDMSFVWEQHQFSISASLGIAELSDELNSKEALIMAADSGCIEAKKLGKNQIVTHESLMKNHVAEEALWINRIIESLDTNRFTLFRQSIVRINAQSPCEHFEVLLRMRNPEGGFYMPGDFLPVAERNDLMPKVDQWVVETAMKWLAEQEIPSGTDYCMNINISANSLANLKFREFLQEKVQHSAQINRYLCFEMTESAAMTNYDQTVALLNSLKENGCKVALDDFGTGFSSLSHIRELPLDYIKIDGCFIQQISDNVLDQTVVRSVAEIAKVLRIKTVAEFVDNEAALKMIEKLHIDYAQGFLFSKPEELSQSTIRGRLNRAA